MLIEVEHLQKRFENGTMPLRDVSCQISEGEVISILGPSGTGKSTFLNLLNRLDQPSGGKYSLKARISLPKIMTAMPCAAGWGQYFNPSISFPI